MDGQPRSRSSGFRRLVIVLVLALGGWHVAASFVWIAPPAAIRDVFPGDSLRSYMLPLFGQDWSVFAPSPINGDYDVEVRAVVADPTGPQEATEWVSITAAELTLITHQPFPSRAGIVSWTAASEYKRAYDRLDDSQQDAVALSFHEGDDWQQRLNSAVARGSTSTTTIRFLTSEERMTGLASAAARALWGDDVEAVQFRVSRTNVVPFADRNSADRRRPDPKIVDSGWRGVIRLPGSSQERFAQTFLPLVERAGQR